MTDFNKILSSSLLMVDRQNRSRNKRIYDRIYREEREQVDICIERIREELQEFEFESSVINPTYGDLYEPEFKSPEIDSTLQDISVSDKKLRFYDVLMAKFDQDELDNRLLYSMMPDQQEEEDGKDLCALFLLLLLFYLITTNRCQ